MNVHLEIAKKAEDIYMKNNLTIQAAIRQAVREYEEKEKKKNDFERILKEIIS
jgi:hypothetical protein